MLMYTRAWQKQMTCCNMYAAEHSEHHDQALHLPLMLSGHGQAHPLSSLHSLQTQPSCFLVGEPQTCRAASSGCGSLWCFGPTCSFRDAGVPHPVNPAADGNRHRCSCAASHGSGFDQSAATPAKPGQVSGCECLHWPAVLCCQLPYVANCPVLPTAVCCQVPCVALGLATCVALGLT